MQWVQDGMPLPPKTAKVVKHHQAVPYKEVPAFVQELHKRASVSARALEVTILTALRPWPSAGRLGRRLTSLWVQPASAAA